jgi:hypothetical protein
MSNRLKQGEVGVPTFFPPKIPAKARQSALEGC